MVPDHRTRMKPGYTLRDYQKRACRRIVDAFEKGVDGQFFTKLILDAAGGSGKTIMSSALAEYWVKRRREKMLFLAHKDKLIEQAIEKIYKSTGMIPDLEKAGSRASLQADIVVGSIQSMTEDRFTRFPRNHFAITVCDEGHRSMADIWQAPLNYFHGGGSKILAITATPERADKISLMRFYEHVADTIPMTELMEALHLSPCTIMTVPLEIGIKSKVGEGENHAMADELTEYMDAIIDRLIESIPDRRHVILFHPSVSFSKKFTERLIMRGESAGHVDGTTKNGNEITKGFERGDFRFLNNCDLLIEGYDAPIIDGVVILKATKSRTSYIQMAVRGTRLYCPHGCADWCGHADRKKDFVLVDFLWAFEEHNIMGPADLLTDNPEQREEVAKKLKKKDGDIMEISAEVIGEREERLLAAIRRQSGRRGITVDARQTAALLHQPALLDYEPVARWESQRPTDKQLEILSKRGIDPGSIRGRGHASKLLDAIFARGDADMATLKQVAALAAEGHKDAHLLTFPEAKAAIDQMYAR